MYTIIVNGSLFHLLNEEMGKVVVPSQMKQDIKLK